MGRVPNRSRSLGVYWKCHFLSACVRVSSAHDAKYEYRFVAFDAIAIPIQATD